MTESKTTKPYSLISRIVMVPSFDDIAEHPRGFAMTRRSAGGSISLTVTVLGVRLRSSGHILAKGRPV
jgi:hypothetical protein